MSCLCTTIDFHKKIGKYVINFQLEIISPNASQARHCPELKEDDKLLVLKKCIDEFPQLVMQISSCFSFLVFFYNLQGTQKTVVHLLTCILVHILFRQYRTEEPAVYVQVWIEIQVHLLRTKSLPINWMLNFLVQK